MTIGKMINGERLAKDWRLGMTIGQRIREARLAKGWTQRELARAMGYTEPYISRVECAKASPSSRALMAFERALGTRIVK